MPAPIAEILQFRQARAFRQTFDLTAPHGGDVERVLADLAEFCCATRSTANASPADMPILEGRRQVWLRIQQFLNFNEAKMRGLKTVHDQYFKGTDDEYDY